MKRINLCLSDADFIKLERLSKYNRVGVGTWARSQLMGLVETSLVDAIRSGRIDAFEQVELFKIKKGAKK